MKINSNNLPSPSTYGVQNSVHPENIKRYPTSQDSLLTKRYPASQDRPFIDTRKFLERTARGENVNLFQELGNSVSVELSDEGLAELNKKLSEIKNENPGLPMLSDEEKAKLLQESIKPLRPLHPIIPNIQTNNKLLKGLEGADQKIVDAAYSIIQKNLLPHNVSAMTEEERQELILVGLEEAKFLADGLGKDKSGLFMEAMNTIAQYGINGTMDHQGNMTYDIRWGAPLGAPDDYISTGEFMKKIAPKEYAQYSAMMAEAAQKNDDRLLMDAMKYFINWESQAYRKNPKPFEDMKEEQVNWKKGIENTKIADTYSHTDRTSLESLIESVMEQNQVLDHDRLLKNLQEFAQMLA